MMGTFTTKNLLKSCFSLSPPKAPSWQTVSSSAAEKPSNRTLRGGKKSRFRNPENKQKTKA